MRTTPGQDCDKSQPREDTIASFFDLTKPNFPSKLKFPDTKIRRH